jgi:hypothetical protein
MREAAALIGIVAPGYERALVEMGADLDGFVGRNGGEGERRAVGVCARREATLPV